MVAGVRGRPAACGQIALDDRVAGVYDRVAAPGHRVRGLAAPVTPVLLGWTGPRGASHAFLQISADNAPALAVRRRFGCTTMCAYPCRAKPGECR